MSSGIMYISAALKRAPIAASLNIITKNLTYCGGFEDYYEKLADAEKPDLLMIGGFSWECSQINRILDFVKQKNKNIRTVVGGNILTTGPDVAMQAMPSADIGVIGEGEETAVELVEILMQHGPDPSRLKCCDGLIFRDGVHGTVTTARRIIRTKLEDLPLPDRDGFEYEKFVQRGGPIIVSATRSCPFNCSFCFHFEPYRQRCLDSLFDEIEYLLQRYRVDFLHFDDELFATREEVLKEFCERIARYEINYEFYIRVTDVTDEKMQWLKNSGCVGIGLGLESFDERILKSMHKKTVPEQIDMALKIVRRNGMGFMGNFIFGDVNDTMDTVQTSLQYRKDHPTYNISIYNIRTLPGNEIYQNALERGIIKDEVDFLRNDCPLVNISNLSDEEFRDIRSMVYIESKYQYNYLTDYTLDVKLTLNTGMAIYTMICPHCGTETTFVINLISSFGKLRCSHCKGLFTGDAFRSVLIDPPPEDFLLFGATELCIKLLMNKPEYRLCEAIVDSDPDLWGLMICGKEISAPAVNPQAKHVLICSFEKKTQESIARSIASLYTGAEVFVPRLYRMFGNVHLDFIPYLP